MQSHTVSNISLYCISSICWKLFSSWKLCAVGFEWNVCCYIAIASSLFRTYAVISSACDKPLSICSRMSINSACSQSLSQVALNWNGVGYIRAMRYIAMQWLCNTYYLQLCCIAWCCYCYQLESSYIGKCSYNATPRALSVYHRALCSF